MRFLRTTGSYCARNRGVLAAQGDVLAFTDSDCIPKATWIEQGVRALLASENIGLVAGKVEVVFESPHRPSAYELYDRLCSLQRDAAIIQARFGATANLFTTRQVMEKVGLFDARLMSGGDRAWGNRVYNAGLRLAYCEKAVILHPARRTLRELIDKSLRVTVATRVAGPDARYSKEYLRRHLIERPWAMWWRMTAPRSPIRSSTKAKVLGLYFMIKVFQIGERVRVWMGAAPRR